jgi:hypothetical protein
MKWIVFIIFVCALFSSFTNAMESEPKHAFNHGVLAFCLLVIAIILFFFTP